MSLITCENAALAYEGHTIVKDLNFTVNSGDYLCIVGENGSGKSTLMKALLRLKEPSEGKISFSQSLSKKDIGYLPQQTAIQRDFPASVQEIVLSGFTGKMGFHPFFGRTEKKKAAENMEKLGIASLAKRCYRELSGGQQQRVLLARALCAAQKLLVLDEPVSGLDPVAAKDLYTVISGLNKKDSMTVIMVSHDIEQAVKYATHILHIRKTPLFFGKTEDYLFSDVCRLFSGKGED